MNALDKFINEIENHHYFKFIFSSPFDKSGFKKVVFRAVGDCENLDKCEWLCESFTETQVFHRGISVDDLKGELVRAFGQFKQCCLMSECEAVTAFNNKGKCSLKRVKAQNKCDSGHNRAKKYFINEGDDVPAMIELGIFTKDLKIVASKYDKFKQINRFIEIINDNLKEYKGKSINIIDFGCGKSYLTFVLYYYFEKIRGIKANISGYDLKEDVVADCNRLADKFGYGELNFYCEDVANVKGLENSIDMLITLHACDVATDYALNYAIKNNVRYVFSVPCCQHEINLSIAKCGGDFDLLMDYGIVKERFSALLTDVIRAKVLESFGYKVDVMEFVDFAHTPKNVMIRAVKVRKGNGCKVVEDDAGDLNNENNKINSNCKIDYNKSLNQLLSLKQRYGFNQKLLQLCFGEDKES